MNLSLIQRLGAALVLAAAVSQAAADDSVEMEQLRAENARLRAQLQQLQQSPPAAVVVPAQQPAAPGVLKAPPQPPAAVAVPTAPSPLPVQAVSPQMPAPAAVVPQSAAPALPDGVAPNTVVPPGYKLVPANTPDYIDPLSPPYDHAGCSRGMLKGPPPAKWNDPGNWLGMRRGLNMAEVTDLLGKEHYDVRGRGRIEWQYGRCGDAVNGFVQFLDGQVVYWQPPES